MRGFGTLLLIGGLIGAFYYFAIFDTSVEVPTSYIMGESIGGGRVNNIGLMSDRQNGILISLGAALIGVLMILFAPKETSNAGNKKCPHCAEWIKAEANVCRFCNRDVTEQQLETGVTPSIETTPEQSAAIAAKQKDKVDSTGTYIVWLLIGGICVFGLWQLMVPQNLSAKRFSTLSNMKQLGLGLAIYLADNDEKFPALSDSVLLHSQLVIYGPGEDMWATHNPNGGEIKGNEFLSGISSTLIDELETTIVLSETLDWPQTNDRCYGFADSHAKFAKDLSSYTWQANNWQPPVEHRDPFSN